jgi:pimeloyl-ACP methyl ester carboxylesterase
LRLSLMQVEASDGVGLPALLFEPRKRSTRVAVWLHGNGGASSFYSVVRTQEIARALAARGVAFFAFNNRGAETFKLLRRADGRRVLAGFAHERIRDCLLDIDGVVRALRRRGYRRIALAGHSTGANKICVYDWKKQRHQVCAFVLVAPGDDVGIYFQALGRRRFATALATGRAKIRAGRGYELVPQTISKLPISWLSLVDTINPAGDYNVFPFLETRDELWLSPRRRLFREVRNLSRPTLAIFASDDEYCFDDVPSCIEILKSNAPSGVPFRMETIAGANHGFGGKERELGKRIARWLDTVSSEGIA